MFPLTKKFRMIYSGYRHQFSLHQFKYNCYMSNKLVFIFRNNLNYVFGGYSSLIWDNNLTFCLNNSDSFIISLRRRGISNNEKFMVKNRTNTN